MTPNRFVNENSAVSPLSGCIRQATAADAVRLAEIEIFNYRLNFYPIS